MSFRRRWDINTRTQLITLGPALLLTLLLISFFTFVRIQDLRQELNHTGQLIANQLAPATEYGVISGNNDVLDSLLRATLATPHVRFLEIQDSSENILVYVEQPSEKHDRSRSVKVFQAPIRLQRPPAGAQSAVPLAHSFARWQWARAALDARHDQNTLILARTDAVAVEGLDAALERAERYLECGVDALFIEALRSDEQMNRACAQFAQRVPLLANMVEGGQTPVESAAELGERGFRIVIFPGGTARAVLHTLQGYYASLQAHQTTRPWQGRMLDFDGLNAAIETPQLLAQGRRYEDADQLTGETGP